MTCRSKGNMIGPCTSQGTLDHLRWAAFRWIQDPHWASCPAGSATLGNLHSSIEHHPDYHLWLQRNGTCPMGKIKLKCQIGDLRSEVTCYVIDADTSYNLLLGWPWIHHNSIVPSTLHQVMKYVDGDRIVRTLITKRHPFKGQRITS